MNEKDASYFAGILDGEGSFGIHPTGRAFVLAIEVVSTDKILIDWLNNNWPKGVQFSKKPAKEHYRLVYSIRWHGKVAQALAREVLPYLVIKRRHAEIFLLWPYSTKGVHPKVEHLQIRQLLVDELRSLNKKRRSLVHDKIGGLREIKTGCL